MKNSNHSTNAFTIIELIFVIVILGILSAVAVPKLAQETAKDTMFEELTEVGAKIRKEIDAQNSRTVIPTKNDMEKSIEETKMWKMKYEKLQKESVVKPSTSSSVEVIEVNDFGTGY